ncbi:MAG: ATP synthase F0 subunit A [Bacteroidetes bacterium]|nr:MAG: ATP synthase F0 subunit A [Bacteroidota bacterium]
MGNEGSRGYANLREGKKILSLLLIVFATILSASAETNTIQQETSEGKKKFDAGKVIIDHILDAYDWHIADYGDTHISIPLPIILMYEGKWYFFFSHKFHHGKDAHKGFRIASDGPKKGRIVRVLDDGITHDPHASFLLDISITKNVLAIFMASVFLCWLLISVARSYTNFGPHRAPNGLAGLLEPLFLFVRDDIARSAIPEKEVDRFLPYLLSLFSFIFFNNLLGLVPFFPGGANVTGSISVTLTLAMFTFFTLHIFANREYWKHIFNTPGVPFWLKLPIPLMPIIELVGVFVKPIVLTLRLFANITAGHMIILGFVSLIFVLGSSGVVMGLAISPLSVLFVIFMNFLELLVAFIQAYVFTFFSAIFFGMAVPEKHH